MWYREWWDYSKMFEQVDPTGDYQNKPGYVRKFYFKLRGL